MRLIEKIKDIIFKIKDYDRLENDYCTCLCYFTNNKMSKPNYLLKEVETVITDTIGEYMDEGYQQAEEDFMEEACKYLEPIIFSMNLGDRQDTDKFIEDFKKHMKGERHEV